MCPLHLVICTPRFDFSLESCSRMRPLPPCVQLVAVLQLQVVWLRGWAPPPRVSRNSRRWGNFNVGAFPKGQTPHMSSFSRAPSKAFERQAATRSAPCEVHRGRDGQAPHLVCEIMNTHHHHMITLTVNTHRHNTLPHKHTSVKTGTTLIAVTLIT